MSHTSKHVQGVSSGEEKDVSITEPEHTSPPPIPPTDPYSTLSASIDQLTLSHKQLHDDLYSTFSHFAASQRLVELHLIQLQHHIGYEIPPPSQYFHPLPTTDLPFPPYNP